MKRFIVSAALLVGLVSMASAEVYDVANKQYQMSGNIRAHIAQHCGSVTISSSVEYPELFSIQFGENIIPVLTGDIVGTFQIKDDNLLAAGQVVNGEIAARKNNKLILKYAGLTSLEGAEKLKNLIHDKALEHGTEYGEAMNITSYSFKSYVRKDRLKFVEVVNISIPGHPRTGCNTGIHVKRKLLGPLIVPPV